MILTNITNLQQQQIKLKQINNNFNIFKEDFIKVKAEYEQLNNILKENISKLEICQNNDKLYNDTKKVINDIILNTRDNALKFIENVITSALQEIFVDKKLELKLILHSENVKTSVSVYIKENDNLFDIESSRGGGLRDIVSFGFLICLRKLCKIDLPLICDESLKFLNSIDDNIYNKQAFKFVRNICDKLGEQIIFITGKINKDAINNANKVICVKQKDGKSYVE